MCSSLLLCPSDSAGLFLEGPAAEMELLEMYVVLEHGVEVNAPVFQVPGYT